MKKSIHFLLLVICTGSLSAQISNANTIIKVQPNTILYSTSGLSITGTGTLVNDGNIQVDGGAFESDSATGSKIKNTYTSATSYGQLILGAAVTAAAADELVHEHLIPSNTTFKYTQISFPFQSTTVEDFAKANGILTSTGYVASLKKGFYDKNSVYFFNNSIISYFPVVYTHAIVPGLRYALNNLNNSFFTSITNNTISTTTNGIPQIANVTISGLDDYSTKTGAWENGTNPYGSVYTSYLQDNTRVTSNPDYLRFGYNFGNPYNSNLDLSYIGISGVDPDGAGPGVTFDLDGVDLNILSIGKMGTGYTVTAGQGNIVGSLIALFSTTGPNAGQIISGDVDALIIKPYEPFGMYFSTGQTSFTFTQGMKTFSMTAKASTDKDGNSLTADGYSPVVITPFSAKKFKKNNVVPTFSSLSFGLKVSAKGSNQGSTTTYVMANQDVVDNNDFNVGYDAKEEAGSLIYTLDNTSDAINTNHKINGIKTDESKYITLGLRLPNGNAAYTLSVPSSSLNRTGGSELDYGKFFKLYDKVKDQRFDITSNFTYDFEQDGATEDRFVIEYGKVLAEETLGNVASNVISSKVVVDGFNNYLFIGDDISHVSIPSVQVYNLTGQLIDNFSTKGDKKILLKNYPTGIYLIKLEGLKNSLKLISNK